MSPGTINPPQPRRPSGVTIVAVLVFTIAGFNLLRLVQALREWSFLVELFPVIPIYMVISGSAWLVVCVWLGWGLWRGKRFAPLATILTMLVYEAYYWIDALLITKDGARGDNANFALLAQLILLAFVILVLTRRNAKMFFGDRYDS